MKSVGEDDIAEEMMRAVVRDVERRIHLQITRDVAGEANRG